MTQRKTHIILVVFLIIAIYGSTYLITSKSAYSRLFVIFSPNKTPHTEVKIQDQVYSLEINLGSKFPLTLNQKTLSKIAKEPCGIVSSTTLEGIKVESLSYRIPKIKIGDLIFKNVLVVQQDDVKEVGVIGRPLLEKINLLLDFSNSTLIACNNIKHLEKVGYHLEDMIKVPFEFGRTGMIIKVDTDFGVIRLGIGTGVTWTLIKSSFLPDQNVIHSPYFTTARFVVAGKDFGNQSLHLWEITPELYELDGILGMDFLKQYITYIDFQKQFLYIGNKQLL